jgi:sulfite oxidase
VSITRRRFLEAAGLGSLAAAWGCAARPLRGPSSDDVTGLVARQAEPYNAEPPLPRLVESWLTPVRSFYVRRHGSVPAVDPEEYALEVLGEVERPLRLTRGDLEALSGAEVVATLQCAGNRRSEHGRTRKVGGVQWDAGAIGNARWGGAPLGGILRRAGVKAGARHVSFTSLDACATPGGKVPFGASIPIEKAMAPETLVALAMNGEALTAEHGYPARTIVPGVIGARSVKWLGTITVEARPSRSFFQARDYKLFGPEVTAETADWESAPAMAEMPVNSAICSPAAGESVRAGTLAVRGYALAPSGRAVARVEVSADGGKRWSEARLAGASGPFAWRFWEADVAVETGAAVLAVRATDSAGGVQPETATWNFKGYLYNGWHRIAVTAA